MKKLKDRELNILIDKSIKYIRRYGGVTIDTDALLQILFSASKGLNCTTSHIDTSQKLALVEYFRDKNDVTDPHLKYLIDRCRNELGDQYVI